MGDAAPKLLLDTPLLSALTIADQERLHRVVAFSKGFELDPCPDCARLTLRRNEVSLRVKLAVTRLPATTSNRKNGMSPIGATFGESSAQTKALQDALAIYEIEKKLQLEQTKSIFEQSKSYQAVIIGLAYGGFFAIWATAKSFVSDGRLMSVAASLMIVSIVAYVLFMIINMYVLSKVVIRNAQLSQAFGSPKTIEDFNTSVQEIAGHRETTNAELRQASLMVAKLWPPFFWISVVTGVLAAMIMLFVLVKNGALGYQ